MSGSSILKGGEKSEFSAQLRRALFRNARAVETAQRGSCQQPARNSPVMRAMTHTCPCCSSPSDVGAILVVWDVSGERTWQSSPLLHNLAVPAHRGTVHPGQGAAAGGTGYKILSQLIFPSPFIFLNPLLLWNNQSNPVSS